MCQMSVGGTLRGEPGFHWRHRWCHICIKRSHEAAIKNRAAGGEANMGGSACPRFFLLHLRCTDTVFKHIYLSSKAAADVRHGLPAVDDCCSPHGTCWWKTCTTSAPSERWPHLHRLWNASQLERGWTKTSQVFSSEQMVALWHLQRWNYSEWKVRRWSSPSRCSAECCRYGKSPPPRQSTPFLRAMGASLQPMRTRSASCRTTSSCGSFQWRLQTPGNTPVPTGAL